jgi:polysaccharide biosynthesis protein VpsM
VKNKKFMKIQLSMLAAAAVGPLASPVLAITPANLQAGPVFITPTLDTEVGYVDNLFRSDEDKKNTGVSVVTPRVQAWLENGLNTYSFTTALIDYRYFDSSPDNITDNTANLDLHHVFDARNLVNVYGEYWDFHEDRGTGLTEGIAQEVDGPTKLDRTTLGGDYVYGSESSRGRLKLGARTVDHHYRNQEELTRYHSRDSYEYNGTFLWNVAARTDALFEVRHVDTEYDRTDPTDVDGSLDSDEFNYLTGVAWEATAQTTGSVKVGMINRDYNSDARSNDDAFSWEVDLNYLPRTYSRFNLGTRRFFNETNGVGNAVDTQEVSLSWNHDWNTRSKTDVSLVFAAEDYTESDRQDDSYAAQALYTYAFRRWADLGVGYRFEELSSDLDFYDYTRNEVFLQAKLSL